MFWCVGIIAVNNYCPPSYGLVQLVNALSKIEARRPKETFFTKITTVVESAVLPQGRAPSSGNDEEKSACDSDSTGWRLER